MRAVVLGGGLIGGVVADELSRDLEVTVADADESKAGKFRDLSFLCADLSREENIREAVKGADVVVNALPGFMGFRALRAVIRAGIDVVDLSFMPEDPLVLDEEARAAGVTAVVDMGVAPGMSNLIVGHFSAVMKELDDVAILVGGLPVVRQWPFEYGIVFSASDTIDEYVRPSRLIEHGSVVEKPALSDLELVDFEGIGTLEAFNTDGLRTLLHTVKARAMREKTMRYPGHAEKMMMLRSAGFFDSNEIDVRGQRIRPLDVAIRLFSERMRLKSEDITVMRVEATGGGERLRYDLYDRYDRNRGITSMARVTGFPCAIVAGIVARGEYIKPGISPPEILGMDDGVFVNVMKELERRDVRFVYSEPR